MHRKRIAVVLTAMFVLTAVLAAPGLAAPGKSGQAQGPRVRGSLTVEGIVSAVNPGASMFVLRVTKPGHARRAGSDTLVVLVQQGTELKLRGRDDDEHVAFRAASIADVRVGDRVKVDGFRLDDGRILALRLDIKNRAVAGPGPLPPAAASGVVTAKGFSSLVILGADGIPRTVLITPSTEFRGQRTSFATVQAGDSVVVQGTVNADGSIVARRVETTFTGGATTTGVITAKSSIGPQFLILNNALAVNVSSDTRIISGGQLRAFGDLQVGQMVTVTGNPITVAGVTVAINARVITF